MYDWRSSIKEILIRRLHGLLGYSRAKNEMAELHITPKQAERLLEAIQNFETDEDVEGMDIDDIIDE